MKMHLTFPSMPDYRSSMPHNKRPLSLPHLHFGATDTGDTAVRSHIHGEAGCVIGAWHRMKKPAVCMRHTPNMYFGGDAQKEICFEAAVFQTVCLQKKWK